MKKKWMTWFVSLILIGIFVAAFQWEVVADNCACYDMDEWWRECEDFCEVAGGCDYIEIWHSECVWEDCWSYYYINCEEGGLRFQWFGIEFDCDDCEAPEE